ncbi:MAG: hypothetical protein FJ010_00345 [Chloroflexi bacterium]|nr:hypothetical protein [Chloroflexota bacterium]
MPTDLTQDPLEGKGEEMIPDKGLPFDDIDDTPLEDIPPEERIPNLEEEEITFDDEQPPLMRTEETIESKETSAFELSDKETEALIGDVGKAFGAEAAPWSFSREEAETLIGDVGEAFPPTEAFGEAFFEDQGLPRHPDEALRLEEFARPPADFADAGMSTHIEDEPKKIEALFSEEVFRAPGPDLSAGIIPPIADTVDTSSPPLTDNLVTQAAIDNLWDRANKAPDAIRANITTLYIAQPMLDRVQAARKLLMAGKENFEEAERHINEVELRVELSIKLKNWSRRLIPLIFMYLAAWFLGLIAVIFVIGEKLFIAGQPTLTYMGGSMIWGGIGGIIGALLPLIQHYSTDQDFSSQHTVWYLTSPPTGVIMGAIIHLFMQAGLISLANGEINSPVIIYILAGLAGYQHNVFTALIKRMLKVLDVGSGSKGEEKEAKKAEKKVEKLPETVPQTPPLPPAEEIVG